MKYLAAIALVITLPAGAHDKPKPEPKPVEPTIVVRDSHKGMCDGWSRFLTCATVGGLAVYGVVKLPIWESKSASSEKKVELRPTGVWAEINF
jgi:hypothetical protein